MTSCCHCFGTVTEQHMLQEHRAEQKLFTSQATHKEEGPKISTFGFMPQGPKQLSAGPASQRSYHFSRESPSL